MEKKMQIKKAFGLLVFIYTLSLYPLIRANFNYIDDMGRVFKGYAGWSNFSRWFSSVLSHFVHAGIHLADISPLPQIMAICIVAFAGCLLLWTIKETNVFSVWDIAAILPLGITPYFLECLSYKYDAPYMALSILASITPLIFCKKDIRLYSIATIASMIIMCTTYQASSGIFPMCVLLLTFLMWNRVGGGIQKILRFVIVSALSYLIGVGIFFLFLMGHVDGYVSNKIGSISNTLDNYSEYFKYVFSDFKIEWLVIIGILSIWFIVVSVWNTKHNKFLAFCISLLVECVMLLLSYGLYPILERPLFVPRALYGVGTYIVLICVATTMQTENKRWKWITRVLIVALGWSFITFTLAYGNALSVQDEYTDFRIAEVIGDLSELQEVSSGENVVVQLNGTIGLAPAIEDGPNNCNMLTRLIPIMFKEEWIWGGYKFFHYYGLKNISWNMEAGMYMDAYGDWPLLHESMYHRIYGQDNYIVIELK